MSSNLLAKRFFYTILKLFYSISWKSIRYWARYKRPGRVVLERPQILGPISKLFYTISYTNIRYRSMLNTISVKLYSISWFFTHDIEGNVKKYSISYVFLYDIEYKPRYRARYRVYYFVLTFEAYDRTGSCPASSCQPSCRQ